MREKYKDKAPGLREELIEREAQCVETVSKKRSFSPGELVILREEHTKLCLKIDELDIQLKSVSNPLKEKIKELKESAKETLGKLKSECEVSDIQVFGFPNYEADLMEYYTLQGDFEFDRKLLVAERQLSIESPATENPKRLTKKKEKETTENWE